MFLLIIWGGRPLPPVRKPLTVKTALKAFGLFCTLTGGGLLGYKLFISIPSYNGPTRDMQNKTVLITQPCAKMSRELLHDLAKRGAHLILAHNQVDQCEEIRERLIRKYSVKSDSIECRRLEIDSLRSVRRLAASVLADFQSLDCAILQSPSCVTSIIAGKRRFTHDGFEYELGANYFATYLLSRLLIDRLNASDGRLIFVIDTQAADIAQESAVCIPGTSEVTIPLENLNWENDEAYTPKNSFQRSQWFLSMFADELARRNSTKGPPSILVSNPRISRNAPPAMDTNAGPFRRVFYKIGDFSRVCPSVVDLTGEGSQKDGLNVVRAPVYQDLRLVIPSKQNDATVEKRRNASQILWDVTEKWTRLDTHPTALPLPKKNVKEVTKIHTIQSASAVHV
uniref:Uncharacterized protein n=1 Tax=Trichobilharzia regenti TaxID=157069 RepID=A0AA85KBF8_TRIRE|nr:unnamed protein product [Trichobilharzia regenti]